MAKYRANLPQLNGDKFITDGGLETTLVFYEGYDLPEVAAFDLLRNDDGYELFKKYYSTYAAIAMDHKVGFIQDRFTWRASSTWVEKLGYSNKALQNVNRKGIELLHIYEMNTRTIKPRW